jgi:hypothetical protein
MLLAVADRLLAIAEGQAVTSGLAITEGQAVADGLAVTKRQAVTERETVASGLDTTDHKDAPFTASTENQPSALDRPVAPGFAGGASDRFDRRCTNTAPHHLRRLNRDARRT